MINHRRQSIDALFGICGQGDFPCFAYEHFLVGWFCLRVPVEAIKIIHR
jgi:hypothetical protein